MIATIARTGLSFGAVALMVLTTLMYAHDVASTGFKGKRVLHVDSYHRGNTWNDEIADAVSRVLADSGVEVKVIHMDTKRNKDEGFKKEAALRVKAEIEAFKPDVVTASDDNAAKYLIAPYYKDAELPFVFCGLNWDASTYGLPFRNVTGMVEVSPIPQILRLLRQYSKGDKIGFLTEDSLTKRKELEYHKSVFGVEYDAVYFVKTFDEWKESFAKAQTEVDQLLILGVAGVVAWDDEKAKQFAQAQTKIPTGTDFGWLMHVSMLGVGKLPSEQGEWAAQAALKILDGTPPSRIPLSYNRKGKLFFNKTISRSLGVTSFPAAANIVGD